MNPQLSIVILHYHSQALLRLCLTSIIRYAPAMRYEIIVIDSETSRESRDLLRESFPGVKLVPAIENTGYAKGVNLGIRHSSGDYILILNPDIVVTEGSIEKLVDFIKHRSDVGLVGPQLLNYDGTVQNSYFRFYTPMTILARRLPVGRVWPFKKMLADFLMADTDPNKIQTPDWITGGAMMVSRQSLNRVGLFDERFFMYFEDVDWSRRFWHNDYKVVYYPQARMYHAHRRESKSRLWFLDLFFNQVTRWHIKSAVQYFLKYRKIITSYD